MAYKQPRFLVQDGVTQFNAVLVGSVLMSLYPALHAGELSVKVWLLVLLGAAATVIVQTSLGNILASVKAPFPTQHYGEKRSEEFGIVGLTLPFNIVCVIIMSILVKTKPSSYLSLPSPSINTSAITTANSSEASTTSETYNKESELHESDIIWGKVNNTESDIIWEKVLIGSVLSMGQVFGVQTLSGSILMFIGVAIFSPLLALVEFLGGLLGSFLALVLYPPPYTWVYAGVWGYCPILTAGALGGFFVVLTPTSIPITLLAIASTTALQSFLIPVLDVVETPVFTIPFVLVTWIFLLLTTENYTIVRSDIISTPEEHINRWKKEKGTGIHHLARAFRLVGASTGIPLPDEVKNPNRRTQRGV
jgi:urea transporter